MNVSPQSATLNPGGTQQFTASVSGGHNSSVTWNVNGTAGGNATTGTVSSSGLYTAPSKISSTISATVEAVSTQDSSKMATATVKVIPKTNASINRTVEPLPIELGTSGGNATDESAKFCCSGTLGALVSRGGSNYILSANHVLAKSGSASTGDPIIQPGLTDASCSTNNTHTVAKLSQMASLKTSNVDAALALVTPGSVDPSGGILELGSGGGVGAPAAGNANPSVGEHVAKSGRSTGLTCSSISSLNTSAKVDYQPSCNTGTTFSVTFTNQLVIAGGSFSSSGDSGALVVDSSTAQPVGLLYAGNDTDTVANPIGDVLNALKDPSSGDIPAVVGGAQHAVACAAAQSASSPAQAAQPLAAEGLRRGASAKQHHERELLSQPAVLGVGVGHSENGSSPVVVVYVDKHQLTPTIPQTLDGVPTRVVPSEHFRAFGWNEKAPVAACAKPAH
ncbi:MAG: Ig-like domain-containing protein [Terriglobales bacterium]